MSDEDVIKSLSSKTKQIVDRQKEKTQLKLLQSKKEIVEYAEINKKIIEEMRAKMISRKKMLES